MTAVEYKHEAVIKVLLEYGADLSPVSKVCSVRMYLLYFVLISPSPNLSSLRPAVS